VAGLLAGIESFEAPRRYEAPCRGDGGGLRGGLPDWLPPANLVRPLRAGPGRGGRDAVASAISLDGANFLVWRVRKG
jgi:hypothetical protein